MSRRSEPKRAGRRERRSAVDFPLARFMGPVRTCVGCRARAARPALLRVVMVGGDLVVDPDRRLPGRGASVHPDLACVDLADKRRAFVRALRADGPLDAGAVRGYVQQHHPPNGEQVEKHELR